MPILVINCCFVEFILQLYLLLLSFAVFFVCFCKKPDNAKSACDVFTQFLFLFILLSLFYLAVLVIYIFFQFYKIYSLCLLLCDSLFLIRFPSQICDHGFTLICITHRRIKISLDILNFYHFDFKVKR